MRDLRVFEAYRINTQYGGPGDKFGGAFEMYNPGTDSILRVIASCGDGWDHVSVSLPDRTPTWSEMEFVKRRFFADDELAWEYHMPPTEHISIHPHVLHIWRKHGFKMPTPPTEMV